MRPPPRRSRSEERPDACCNHGGRGCRALRGPVRPVRHPAAPTSAGSAQRSDGLVTARFAALMPHEKCGLGGTPARHALPGRAVFCLHWLGAVGRDASRWVPGFPGRRSTPTAGEARLIDWIGPFRHVGEWIGAREKRIAWILVFYAVAIVSMALFDLRAKASHVMPEVWGFLDATVRGTQLAASDGGDLVPVVLVDIDEASARKWGFQGHTPRDRLARVLEVISRAQPAAIVVDVDLSDDPHCPCFHDEAGDKALRAFIERYPGKAPLVFVKRTEADAEGRTTIAPSPYDPLFARSGSVSWAHAHFVAD